MTDIDLKFSPEMARLVLDGRKCATTRDRRKGWPGDEFEIGGVRFRILDIHTDLLSRIAIHYTRLEGFDDPSAFVETVERIYPGVDIETPMVVHFFARCP